MYILSGHEILASSARARGVINLARIAVLGYLTVERLQLRFPALLSTINHVS